MVAGLAPVPDQIKSTLLLARRSRQQLFAVCGRDGAPLIPGWVAEVLNHGALRRCAFDGTGCTRKFLLNLDKRKYLAFSHTSAVGLGCVKTRSDLVVMRCGEAEIMQ